MNKLPMVIISVVLLVLICSSTAMADWEKTFGGSGHDRAHDVQQTSDGGYIIAAATGSFGAGGLRDAWLIKTDASGNEQWNKTFGGTGYDGFYGVQQTTGGGYIAAGWTDLSGTVAMLNAWLVKTDADGNEQWSKTFGGTDYDFAKSVQQTTDGGYVVAGYYCNSSRDEDWDAWLIKTDADGNEQWSKTFGKTTYDFADYVRQTADGGYIMAGSTEYGNAGIFGYAWLIKTDADGNMQWDNSRLGYGATSAYGVQQTADGGYITAGRKVVAGGEDSFLIKVDTNGNVEWEKDFGGVDADRAYSVQLTSDGGYVIPGETWSFGAGDYDAWFVKTDATGNLEWDKTFGGIDEDWAETAQQTSDGGFIIAANTFSFGEGSCDILLIKISAPDADGDGVPNDEDNCPDTPNPRGTWTDIDGIVHIDEQPDFDLDGLGDACDDCPNDPENDIDEDGWCGDVDNCPYEANDQLDSDGDAQGDVCDSCPFDPDNDIDGDGLCADEDNCPLVSNPSQEECDDDGLGNACDLDDDDDGLSDDDEVTEGTNSCNPDTDGDGVVDGPDQCKLEDATGFDADLNGCVDTADGLIDIINTLPDEVLSDETKNSLVAKVETAERSIDKEKDQAAINQLNAFINEIEAQRGKKISDDAADMLVQYALNIIAQIEAS